MQLLLNFTHAIDTSNSLIHCIKPFCIAQSLHDPLGRVGLLIKERNYQIVQTNTHCSGSQIQGVEKIWSGKSNTSEASERERYCSCCEKSPSPTKEQFSPG